MVGRSSIVSGMLTLGFAVSGFRARGRRYGLDPVPATAAGGVMLAGGVSHGVCGASEFVRGASFGAHVCNDFRRETLLRLLRRLGDPASRGTLGLAGHLGTCLRSALGAVAPVVFAPRAAERWGLWPPSLLGPGHGHAASRKAFVSCGGSQTHNHT